MKKLTKFALVVILGMGVVAAVSLIYKAKGIRLQRPSVTTSFYPLFFFSSEIGGDKLVVKNITPVGAEPHDYEPTLQDIVEIRASRLLVLNGGGVEPWANKVKEDLAGGDTSVVEVGQGLLNQFHSDENGEKATDPHVWLSPRLAQKLVEIIFLAVIEIDSTNENYYRNNRDDVVARLKELDKKYKTGLASCKTKDIVTAHEAFGYLAAEYGLNQVAIAGISPDDEPSLKELAKIADFVKARKIKYIFFENLVSPELSETVAGEVGAKILVLNPLEGLSQDEIDKGENYFSIMEQNLVNLRIALECT